MECSDRKWHPNYDSGNDKYESFSITDTSMSHSWEARLLQIATGKVTVKHTRQSGLRPESLSI